MPIEIEIIADLAEEVEAQQAQIEGKRAKTKQKYKEKLPGEQPNPKTKALVEARQVEVTQWEEAHRTYRDLLETLSLTLHPFRISDSAPQTSAQVESQLQAMGEAMATFAQRHQLPARHDAMTKVRKQVPALAALVDCWWQGVNQDLEPFVLSPRWRQWVDECRSEERRVGKECRCRWSPEC